MDATEARRKRQIVVSLPAKGGEAMKNYLQQLADKDDRSLSNQAATIIRAWINDNAPFGWDISEDDKQAKQQTRTSDETVEDHQEGSGDSHSGGAGVG